jgi:hypothetical protein
MSESSLIHVLAAVRLSAIVQYRENLSKDPQLQLTLVTSETEARTVLDESKKHTDVFVIDNGLGEIFEFIKDVRQSYPRLLILLVDDEADFGMPGHADEVSTEPFHHDDLLKRIKRLTEERRLETLRADALPPVRAFAKSLRRAGPGQAKQQAAVEAIQELGYDYVAIYTVMPTTPPELSLNAQVGQSAVTALGPPKQDYATSLLGWVAQNGQSRIVGPDEDPNHPFVRQGRFGAGVCVPIGTTLRFGVIFACREQPNAITQQNVMLLELISAQLASALAKQSRS